MSALCVTCVTCVCVCLTNVCDVYVTCVCVFHRQEGGSSTNYLARLWWFPMFRYFERNVRAPVPRHYEWPLPWPRCLQSKRPDRTS